MSGNGNGNTSKRGRVRLVKRYELPPGCDIESVAMRELGGDDDTMVAINVAQLGSEVARSTPIGAMKCEEKEAIRLALVAVDDERVNTDAAEPYLELDNWSQKTMLALKVYFTDLNGMDMSVLEGKRKAGVMMMPDGVTRAPTKASSEASEKFASA